MRVLHVIAAYYPSTAYGGPVVSSRHLFKAQVATGDEVHVATTDADGIRRVPLRSADEDGVAVRYFRTTPINRFGVSVGLWRYLWGNVGRFDVVHCHGTALPSTTVALWAAKARSVAVVVSPHGSMMAWARKQRSIRKSAYGLLDAPPLQRALFHATSEQEAADLRRAGWKRIVVIPNAVDLQQFEKPVSGDIRARLKLPASSKVVAWLGRFDPVKNLEALLDATAGLGVHTVLAGPDDNQYGRALNQKITREGRQDVHFLGFADDDLKRTLLQQANAYVHPSFMESYGMSIAEALACSCPVVASTGTPWAELEESGAGQWTPPTVEAIRAAILTVLDESQLRDRRRAARALAEQHSWADRARRMRSAYDDLLQGRLQ